MSNKIGISTACFYPLETEISFYKLCDRGIKSCEVFFNTPSELTESFISDMNKRRVDSGISITSVHPFASFAETYNLFSSYTRRYRDTLELYKRYFEVMNTLGALVLVIHGCKYTVSISDEEYFERFGEMARIGLESGCIVAQENVVDYKSESPEFLLRMRSAIGDNFKMVLDNKQALRANYSPFEYIDVLGESIAHIHLSDNSPDFDCIPPGEGNFEFEEIFRRMNGIGYKGNYTVELYSKSYSDENQIYNSRDYLDKLYFNSLA